MKLLFLSGFLCMASIMHAQTTVTFKISGMEKISGTLRMSIYNSKETYMEKPFKAASKKVEGKEVVFVFENIPEGTYGASAYHDEDDDGELDSNLMGIPKESYCFSNNARGRFGPASFEDSSFEVKGKSVVQELVVK